MPVLSAHKPKKRKLADKQKLKMEARKEIKKLPKSKHMSKLIAALLYWGSGSRNDHEPLRFTSSDPDLVMTFIRHMKKSYSMDPDKFRVLMHLHEYHDIEREILFWSSVTGIKTKHFTKPNITKVRKKRQGYHGCIRITYHDTKLADTLRAWYMTFGHEAV